MPHQNARQKPPWGGAGSMPLSNENIRSPALDFPVLLPAAGYDLQSPVR